MKAKVKLYATYREITGLSEGEVNLDDGAKVYDLLQHLFEKYGEKLKNALIDRKTGNLSSYVKIFKNGRDIDFLEGLSTKLEDGDLIVMFPPIAGG